MFVIVDRILRNSLFSFYIVSKSFLLKVSCSELSQLIILFVSFILWVLVRLLFKNPQMIHQINTDSLDQ